MGLIAAFQRARTNQLLADQLSVMQGGVTAKEAFERKMNGPGSVRYERMLPGQLRFWRKISARHPEPEYTEHLREMVTTGRLAGPPTAGSDAIRAVIAERETAGDL